MPVAGSTLPEMFLDRIRKTPDRPAMRFKEHGVWRVTTWAAAGAAARELAAALLSFGIAKGETINILSANRPEWHLADWGSMLAGALPVPIYATNSPEQVAYVAGHSGARLAFVEDADQLRKIAKISDQLPRLERIVLIRGPSGEPDPRVVSGSDFREAGRTYGRANAAALEARMHSLAPEDLATIVYTSGRRGCPRARC